MFPRYKYHLELIQKIVDREQKANNKPKPKSSKSIDLLYKRETDEEPEPTVDHEIGNKDVSTLPQSNILVYGRATNEIRKLLHPLEIQEPAENEELENVILVAFSDEIDADLKTSFYSTIQEQMNKGCYCILVSSETDTKKRLKKSPDRKFSIVPPNTDAVWNHLTSAMELKLINFLNDKSENMDLPLSIREDVITVLRRIEKCSVIKQNHESNEIPKKIQDVLKRFGNTIVRYGFNFDKFRVVVKNERFDEVNKALDEAGLYDSFPINVIREDDLVEKIKPFKDNLPSQGRELFDSHDQDDYGTLGCLALMNNKTVALTCKHVCDTNKYAYIFNKQNPRICLGKCLYTSNEESKLDFAIVKVIRNIEQTYFRNKKLLNSDNEQTNASVFSSNNFDFMKKMHGQIVHKIGAKTDVTQGEIVGTECFEKVYQRIKVRGMNDELFGEEGDSGSIVFREIFGAKERHIEVIAMFLGGSKDEDTDTIVCTVLHTAIDHIKSLHGDMSFTFFNE